MGGLWSLAALIMSSALLPDATPRGEAADISWVPEGVVTNIAQLQQLDASAPGLACVIRLEGNVLWSNPARRSLVLEDESGAGYLEMDLRGQQVGPGQRVRMNGNAAILRRGPGFQIGVNGPVVVNNGMHVMVEKTGAVFLSAGRHPVRLEWFNGVENLGLEVEYEGPGVPRQRIPDDALFRREERPGDTSSPDFVNGLTFHCFEGVWEVLPDFSLMEPVKSGTVPNFNPDVRTRNENVGLQLAGWLKVPRSGGYRFHLKSDDGSRLYLEESSIEVTRVGTAELPPPTRISIGQILSRHDPVRWAEVEGKVTLVRPQAGGFHLELSAGAGRMNVEVVDESNADGLCQPGERIQATGFCLASRTIDGEQIAGSLLVPDRDHIQFIQTPTGQSPITNPASSSNPSPVLTTARSVHALKRREAEHDYAVSVRGVVTCVMPERQGFTVQDSTRGLYMEDLLRDSPRLPEIGEFLEVEGTTDPGLFAPMVNASRIRSLGKGQLPNPVHPTWDQLMNGSLDAQYVEIQGIVTAVQTNGITLLTRGGVIRIELRVTGMNPEQFQQYEHALVRVRGCLFASWDYVTHQVKLGEVRIYDADLFVDRPAPTDLFSTPPKTAAQLLLFDPQAGAFQRVKVSGQIIHVRDSEYFMMDESHGVRFIPKDHPDVRVGDRVEVVGFPDLWGAASPILREAAARKLAHSALPQPRQVPADDLVRADLDATLVRLEAKLVSLRPTPLGEVLELQSGVRTFAARLKTGNLEALSLPAGALLELTGAYAGLGGNRAAGQDITSFELLLNSPSDIKVLKRPPWWTLKRLLVIMGALACVLAGAGLWITQLHRQVEDRTAELGNQIRERERVEHQHALERERARIAQDLHDELGSDIATISMLAARAKLTAVPAERRVEYLDQVGGKAREMVADLDEIVWAMNPVHDSLSSLMSYFSRYADRFLGLANIRCQFGGGPDVPDFPLDSRQRHQLFMAFKEALTNIVRHSGARSVSVKLEFEPGELRLSVTDNGRGLPDGRREQQMNGIAGMRGRVEKLGGRFDMESVPERGTTVKFSVPLTRNS